MNEPDAQRLTFNTLGKYDWPTMPTDESLKRFGWRVWKYFENDERDPFIADDSLSWANKRRLDYIASPPACAPVTDEMEATFSEWVVDDHPARWLHLVVLPPGDRSGVLQTWAEEYGHPIVEPPPRSALLDRSADFSVPGDDSDSLIVIPRLDSWFLRHQDGLAHVRRLLEQLSVLRRHCLIGCNSWAWQFLNKAVHAGRLVPVGLVPNAFDAVRLEAWLMELAEHDGQSDHVFRLSADGSIIDFNFFAKLSARSLGIPWVAWQLWRRALRVGPGDDRPHQQKFPDEQTMWVSGLDDFALPRQSVNIALLTLHALLIHDSLTADELNLVTPTAEASNLLPSLVEAELVDCADGRYACVPAAYPVIRSALIAAGFPKDVL
ncbi:hypothetical protein [Roseimaritima ulvae]|uniref:Uncharacterized protein n=1 Tax=Roseimaritima ulvae TaxID=980254 RepID=A0A5B9R5M6_9BACT|nr:hypothetical protein [Roseimaritima ulvae]QEG41831.1 hypothetical protein UC8_38590 [Roseimaritima ulvae]